MMTNTIHCTCGRSYRFKGTPRGQIIYKKDKPLLGIIPTSWKPQKQLWTDPITKYRCKCGKNLQIHR